MNRFLFMPIFILLCGVSPVFPYVHLGATNNFPANPDFLIPPAPGLDYEPLPVNSAGSMALVVPSSAVSIRTAGGIGQVNTVSVDGGLSSHTRIAFDGMVLEFPHNQSFDLGLFPLEFAARVDIYKNNLAPFGYNASGGMVDFRLPEFLAPKLTLGLSAGTLYEAGAKALLALPYGNGGLLIGGSIILSENKFNYTDNLGADAPARNLDFQRYSLLAKWNQDGWYAGLAHTSKQAGAGIKYPGEGRQADSLSIVNFGYKGPDFSFGAGYLLWFSRFTNSLGMNDTHISHTFDGDCETRMKDGIFGISLKLSSKTFLLDSTKLGMRFGEDMNAIAGVSLSPGAFQFGGNINLIWRWGAGLVPVPGVSAEWKAFDGFSARISVSRHYRPPTMNDLYWPYDGFSSGNTNLRPEEGLIAKAGAVWISGGLTVSVSTGLSLFDGLILWKPDTGGVWSPVNSGKASAWVGDIFLRYEGMSGWWRLGGSAGFSCNRTFNSDEASAYFGKRLTFIPLYKFTLTLHADFAKEFGAEVSLRGVSERFTDDWNSHWLDPYVLIDLRLRYSIFTLQLNNLLDASYSEQDGYPMPGFNMSVGINIELI